MPKTFFLIPFSSPLDDGCDYALQTIKQLSQRYEVIGLVLHQPYTWRNFLSDIINRRQSLIAAYGRARLIRPIYFIPGQRLRQIVELNLVINAWFYRWWASVYRPTQKHVLWFFEPYQTLPFLRGLSGWKSIYDCVDYFSLLNTDTKEKEEEILRKASLVVVNSQVLYRLHQPSRPALFQVPLGFAASSFKKQKASAKTSSSSKSNSVVGFVGGINYRLDFKLLQYVITRLPQVTFRFIGPQQTSDPHVTNHLQKLKKLPNTEWLPPVSKDEIGTIIDTFDIGLIPYDIQQPFNRFCFPMKLLEYFHLGKPVVSTAILELERLKPLVSVTHTPAEFLAAIKNQLSLPAGPDMQRHQKTFATKNSWEKKVQAITNLA